MSKNKVGPVTLLTTYVYRDFILNELIENKERMRAFDSAECGTFKTSEFFLFFPKLPMYVPPEIKYVKLIYLKSEYEFIDNVELPSNSTVLNLGGMRQHIINNEHTVDAYTNALYRVYDESVQLSIPVQPQICSGETFVLVFF